MSNPHIHVDATNVYSKEQYSFLCTIPEILNSENEPLIYLLEESSEFLKITVISQSIRHQSRSLFKTAGPLISTEPPVGHLHSQ